VCIPEFPIDLSYQSLVPAAFPETDAQLRVRVLRAIERITQLHTNSSPSQAQINLVFVCHGHMLDCMLRTLCPAQFNVNKECNYAALSKLVYEPNHCGWRLVKDRETEHIQSLLDQSKTVRYV
jgi:broad specificity phosphatase PhoE